MTPALTKQEAKEKCIKMWEHIAEHITDKEWRAKAAKRYDGSLYEAAKELAVGELFPDDDPGVTCYLCALPDVGCDWCPLDFCGIRGSPYRAYQHHIANSQYARASAAATRLVEKVRAWEVEA